MAGTLTAAQRAVQTAALGMAKRYYAAKTATPSLAATELQKAMELSGSDAKLRAWLRAVIYESKTGTAIDWTISDAAGLTLAAKLDALLTTAPAAAAQAAVPNKALTTTATTAAPTTAAPVAQAAVTTAAQGSDNNMLLWIAGGLGLLLLLKKKKRRR